MMGKLFFIVLICFFSKEALGQNPEQEDILFRDTVYNIAFDSLKHNFGKIHPILDKSIFSKTKEFIPYGIDIESGLTEQDRIELINEYTEIEKEIYNGIPFLGRIESC